MHIGMNSWSLPPRVTGGLDIHVWELARALSEKNVKIELFVPRTERDSPDRQLKITNINYAGDLSYQGVSRLNKKIFTELQSSEIDIFHSHDWFGVEAGYRAKKYLGCNWVFSCHSLEWMRAGQGQGNCKIKQREKLGIEKSDKVITVSEWMKNEMLDRFTVEPDKVVVINNGRRNLEASNFSPRAEHDLGDAFFVFYVGRLAEQKGVRYLLYAAQKILQEFDNVKFVIGGRGPLLEPLQEFTDLLGTADDVIFTGFIPEERLSSYYSEADVFVSPSLHEPFGMTLLEARKQGTPVISTPAGALESLKEGSGFTSINQRCSQDIYRAIKQLIAGQDPAHTTASKTYSWQETAKKTLEVYRQVFNRPVSGANDQP